MALGTDGSHRGRRILAGFRKRHEGRVVGVIGVGVTMTDKAVVRNGRERVQLGIDSRGVTAGTFLGELLCVPLRVVGFRERRLAVFVERATNRENVGLAVSRT